MFHGRSTSSFMVGKFHERRFSKGGGSFTREEEYIGSLLKLYRENSMKIHVGSCNMFSYCESESIQVEQMP